MKFVIEILYAMLTMKELIVIRSIAMIIAIVLGFILCKFTNVKTILSSVCVVLVLVILGFIVFLNGAIEGWAILTFLVPFFAVFIIITIVYCIIKWIGKIKMRRLGKRAQRDDFSS